jgi:hypothetical protein
MYPRLIGQPSLEEGHGSTRLNNIGQCDFLSLTRCFSRKVCIVGDREIRPTHAFTPIRVRCCLEIKQVLLAIEFARCRCEIFHTFSPDASWKRIVPGVVRIWFRGVFPRIATRRIFRRKRSTILRRLGAQTPSQVPHPGQCPHFSNFRLCCRIERLSNRNQTCDNHDRNGCFQRAETGFVHDSGSSQTARRSAL